MTHTKEQRLAKLEAIYTLVLQAYEESKGVDYGHETKIHHLLEIILQDIFYLKQEY